MFEKAYKIPVKLGIALSGMLGMGYAYAGAELTAKKLIPDGKGGMKLAPHPNRLKAMLGFHDVRYGHKCITDDFVEFVVDQLQTETSAFGDFKYHDSGIGTDAEAAGDSALGTAWGGSRDIGTQTEGATANIYKSVATTTYNDTKAITEHGLFNASADGILMDRTLFSAINVVLGNAIEWTFQVTVTSGG
jgi:hypothetical protein